MEERVPRPCAKIVCGLNDSIVKILQARQHSHDDVRNTEGDVRNKNRPKSAPYSTCHEKHEKRNADQNIRHDKRRIYERMVDRLKPPAPLVERERSRRPENA